MEISTSVVRMGTPTVLQPFLPRAGRGDIQEVWGRHLLHHGNPDKVRVGRAAPEGVRGTSSQGLELLKTLTACPTGAISSFHSLAAPVAQEERSTAAPKETEVGLVA